MRILVVRIGRAGDMVMTTPAIRALLQCFPDSKLTFLTSLDGKRILNGFDTRIEDTWVWNRSSIGSPFIKSGIIRRLGNTAFDKIFCFETNPSITSLFDKHTTEFYGIGSIPPWTHCARIYLDMVANVCPDMNGPFWVNLPISTDAVQKLDVELSRYGISQSDTVIALHPTYSGYSRFNLRKRSARKHKLWPAENYAQLATQLCRVRLADGSFPHIILDLLDNEMAVGKKIASLAGNAVKLINEKPNFERYKALLKRANLLVAPDTGPMHIAAAMGTRIVALFSGKSPADCGPYMPADMFTALQAENIPDPDQGIAAISVDAVYQACIMQLDAMKHEKDKKG